MEWGAPDHCGQRQAHDAGQGDPRVPDEPKTRFGHDQPPQQEHPRPHQIPHRLLLLIRNPHRRQLPATQQPRQLARVPPVRLDPLARRLRNPRRRPSGASVWAAPAYDAEHGRLYFATGQNFSHPTTGTSDALFAASARSGEIAWVRQFTANDAYTAACNLVGLNHPNCRDPMGPDVDYAAQHVDPQRVEGNARAWSGQRPDRSRPCVQGRNPGPDRPPPATCRPGSRYGRGCRLRLLLRSFAEWTGQWIPGSVAHN